MSTPVFIIRAVVLAMLVALLPMAGSPAATADRTSVYQWVNDVRASAGKGPLQQAADLNDVAQRWSTVMANENRLYHNPNLGSQVSNYRRAAENVGYGPTEWSVHQALVDSPGHYANIVGDYDQIGIGIVTRDNKVWITQVFRKRMEIHGTPSLNVAGPRAVSPVKHTVYSRPFTSDLYSIENGSPQRIDYATWRSWGYPKPHHVATDLVRYPWTPAVRAVTFWPGAWEWQPVSYDMWSAWGFPGVRHAGWIDGSKIVRDAYGPDLYVIDPDGATKHKLTYAQWAAMDFRPPTG